MQGVIKHDQVCYQANHVQGLVIENPLGDTPVFLPIDPPEGFPGGGAAIKTPTGRLFQVHHFDDFLEWVRWLRRGLDSLEHEVKRVRPCVRRDDEF